MTGVKLQFPTTRTAAYWLLALLVIVAPAATAGMVTPEPPGTRTEPAPEELKGITIDEHLNAQLPLDLTFTDERNRPVQLREFFNGKRPVILQLGYYSCPMLCSLVSRGLVDSLKPVQYTAGEDYELVFISIDPNEDWQLAQGKKRSFLKEYNRPGADSGWHFLTGKADAIEKVAKAVEFHGKGVPSVGQFSHPAEVAICTPDGKLSRYLYGVRFDEKTLRLSLVEASKGQIGTTVDHFLLTCFQYDGKQGKYAMTAMTIMRMGGALTMVILFGVLFTLFRREAHRRRAEDGHGGPPGGGTPTAAA